MPLTGNKSGGSGQVAFTAVTRIGSPSSAPEGSAGDVTKGSGEELGLPVRYELLGREWRCHGRRMAEWMPSCLGCCRCAPAVSSRSTKAARIREPLSESAPEGIRTPNLLIRSQMLYPLSYGRMSTGARSSVSQPEDYIRITGRLARQSKCASIALVFVYRAAGSGAIDENQRDYARDGRTAASGRKNGSVDAEGQHRQSPSNAFSIRFNATCR